MDISVICRIKYICQVIGDTVWHLRLCLKTEKRLLCFLIISKIEMNVNGFYIIILTCTNTLFIMIYYHSWISICYKFVYYGLFWPPRRHTHCLLIKPHWPINIRCWLWPPTERRGRLDQLDNPIIPHTETGIVFDWLTFSRPASVFTEICIWSEFCSEL